MMILSIAVEELGQTLVEKVIVLYNPYEANNESVAFNYYLYGNLCLHLHILLYLPNFCIIYLKISSTFFKK
jgi:hypothetical protein